MEVLDDHQVPFPIWSKVGHYSMFFANPHREVVEDSQFVDAYVLPDYLQQFVAESLEYEGRDLGQFYESHRPWRDPSGQAAAVQIVRLAISLSVEGGDAIMI